MQDLMSFSQKPPAINSAFFNVNTTTVYRNAFIPIYQNVKFSKITKLKAPRAQFRPSLEGQDTSIRGTNLKVHGLSQKDVGVHGGGEFGSVALVGIIMGSDSDLLVMKDAVKILREFNVPVEVKIVSAHWTSEMMFSYVSSAHERGTQVIIAGAGDVPHFPGMVAALTPLPVICVPVCTSTLDGLDLLVSIIKTPRGVPVATVAINNSTNAGLLAVRWLGIRDVDLHARMAQYDEDRGDEVVVKDEKLEKYGWENYLNS